MRREQRKIILSARLPNMNSITPAMTIFAHDVPALLTGGCARNDPPDRAGGKSGGSDPQMFAPHRW
ncbi:hypothetical protein J4734_28930 [Klebsiella pneumoniae]|uniref:Uncharacterized protein n=1 Tax=Klebsiella pneumoniae TaxID=573 RepID=A0A939NSU7_KLEPN|nr:hypothetical protein [Klebsiella pneumoniae]